MFLSEGSLLQGALPWAVKRGLKCASYLEVDHFEGYLMTIQLCFCDPPFFPLQSYSALQLTFLAK